MHSKGAGVSAISLFHRPWQCGIVLFGINFILFGSIVGSLLSHINIPIIALAFIGLAGSMLAWTYLTVKWQGTQKDKRKMSFIGSSFYLVMALLFVYRYFTIKPSYPGDDLFMAYLGLEMGIFVALVAFVTCFLITGKGVHPS
ncbi:hypothetical protein [Peribacillus sp. SCS-155]|uniref:hypothetical protein n=1 Tax=Peribacillus sedimenti TaxID=3115297 RepID=UPI0039065837